MRNSIRIPAALALTLALAVPALAQTTHQHNAPAAPAVTTDTAKTATPAAPPVDPNKVYLLRQDYIAKTAELRGKLVARQAELETLLATKPGDTAAVTKLTTEISALRGKLFEQDTLFRIRYAKETGTPIRMTRHMGRMEGMMMDGMMGGKMMMGPKSDADCKMMGKDKGMMMMGKDMMQGKGMMQGMQHDMKAMNHGATGAMPAMNGAMPGHNMPMPAANAQNTPAAAAPAAPSAPAAPANTAPTNQ
ncbi:periplasmic heavy metal sensor [Solidesulfovibrio sp. C21]|uniref:periplasmic heavy metal sensor n=1 Tax=Solidesulfovibrio sp. C21 TaxID=3398613 RepID=UPI0039FD0A95